jgi:hypothetical protein
MRVSYCLGVCAFALALLVVAEPARAQAGTPERQGFWINVGLGGGSLGCSDCGTRETGLSGQLSLGGTINKHLLIGASSNGWTKSEDGITLTMSSLTAMVRYYPSATGGFYLTGGLGVSQVDLGIAGYGSGSDTGTSALLGLGYDLRIGKNVSLTPFWNGIGASFDGGDANFGQIGISFTWH